MEITEVPFPALNKGQILIRNHFSVISAGTEGKTVSDARKGYIAKAKSRKKEINQVVDMVKANGLLPTYKFVMNKLEAPAPLGYSCAGEVIALGKGVTKVKVGDYVACGGQGAYHADVVAVPQNLVVRVPKNVDMKQAAFSTIAAIAIQGIRQSDLRIGENCLIIGMGLIGQITYKILEASGIFPLGIDISSEQIDYLKEIGLDNVYNRKQSGLESIIKRHSNGNGIDVVIITATTSSLDPVEFAGIVSRKKGKVVVVGAVPTGFDRKVYYEKELELRMSSSYGPGRYDSDYEDKGIDYPVGYVRWTENRNMQSFIDLLANDRMNMLDMISHSFRLEDSIKAYDMILERKENFSGIVIEYNKDYILKNKIVISSKEVKPEDANVGLIGAGSFAQGFLLPNMKNNCNFVGIFTGKGNSSVYIGKKYGFQYLANNADQIIEDNRVNTVFIVTRNNLHSEYVLKSLKSRKHIFVEKPLALNEKELIAIRKAYQKSDGQHIMVGFNRRFSPAIMEMMKIYNPSQQKSIMMRISSAELPVDHWSNDSDIGGGRVISDACHFIDLAMFLAQSNISSVSADTMNDINNLNNTVVINLKFENGSVASISYFSNGHKSVSKEYIEVYSDGMVAHIDDFKSLIVYGEKKKIIKYRIQDKGHKNCVQTFLNSVKHGEICPIPFDEIYHSSLATILINKSIIENRKIELNVK